MQMDGLYWGLVSLFTLLPELDVNSEAFGEYSPKTREEIIGFVLNCQHEDGGMGPNIDLDAHITSTLYGTQIMLMLNALDHPAFNKDAHVDYLLKRQTEDGSWEGDSDGERDTRFTYCGIQALKILGALDRIDRPAAINSLRLCRNTDGAYAMSRPFAESHGAGTFVALGSLYLLNERDPREEEVAKWLAWRQTADGGLNGRPEKLQDVCYSWWDLSALAMLGRLHWIDRDALLDFILRCQNGETGGFSDRPGGPGDIFHTCFGLAGCALFGVEAIKLRSVDPIYCLPCDVVARIK